VQAQTSVELTHVCQRKSLRVWWCIVTFLLLCSNVSPPFRGGQDHSGLLNRALAKMIENLGPKSRLPLIIDQVLSGKPTRLTGILITFDSATRTLISKDGIDVLMRGRGGFVIRLVNAASH
jgi:hypothetical protein